MPLKPEDFKKTKALSESGCRESRYLLSLSYLEGSGVRQDLSMAAHLMLSAYSLGSQDAITQINAFVSTHGDSVLTDHRFLTEVMAEAALHGRMMYHGLLLREKNARSSIARASAGESTAQFDCAIFYLYGACGLVKNIDRGLHFMEKAYLGKNHDAAEWISEHGYLFGLSLAKINGRHSA